MKAVIQPAQFDKTYFNTGNYQNYKKIAAMWSGRVARRIKKDARKIAPRVLDVGCAHGYLMTVLQELGCEVKGLEYSQYAVEQTEPVTRSKIKKGSILENSFRQNEFDVVVCLNVLEYIPEAQVSKALGHLVQWTGNLIFFTTCFTHSRYSSQKHSPDPLRLTVKTEKEWVKLFRQAGANFHDQFYDSGGGDVLVFKKRQPERAVS